MSLVGPKPKTVSVIIKVDTTQLMASLQRLHEQTERIRARRATLAAMLDAIYFEPVRSWENEGGAL